MTRARSGLVSAALWILCALATACDGSGGGGEGGGDVAAIPDWGGGTGDMPPFDCGAGCVPSTEPLPGPTVRILYLHHSTGEVIWNGGVPQGLETYNAEQATDYAITEQAFPKDSPYGWENYPYDYWNVWVAHAGSEPYLEEPTLEMLSADYEVVSLKHCFPVSDVQPDEAQGGEPADVASSTKSLQNYRLQYLALKAKLRAFPAMRFLVWTGAARKQSETSPDEAARAQAFAAWVRDEWDEPGDNIFVWDFRALETAGGLYLLDPNATDDSHPNEAFASRTAPLFVQRLIDVIEGRGDTGSVTGE